MKTLIAIGGALLIVLSSALLVKSCQQDNPEVIVQIEFPSKKQDRHQQYWFLTMARGYAI
jgi:hypothetical protein